MPRNGSGVHSWPVGTTAVSGTTIESAPYNAMLADAATALSESLNTAGTATPTANQPMGTYKHTGLGAGSARTDSVQLGQVQDAKLNWVAAGGTADAITATYSPAITALVDGQECCFRASTANATTTPTFAPNGLTARTIVKRGGSALVAGDILGANAEVRLRYNLANTRWELQDAAPVAASTTEVLTGTNTAKYVTPDALAALWETGGSLTDGATIPIADGGVFTLTVSTVAITAFSITTDKVGRRFTCRFNTIRTLTNNAAISLPGGASITTAVGDMAGFRSLGGGNVECEWYTRANGAPIVGLTSATAQASTSGTSIDFTSIPATAKRITVMLEGVSTSGTSSLLLQIGDSGGVETTGYLGSSSALISGTATSTSTTGFLAEISSADSAAAVRHGVLTLSNLTGNTWVANGCIGLSNTAAMSITAGSKTLSATLDRVRITTVGGTDTFDAGNINIMYE